MAEDAEVNVDINADPSRAARQIEDAFTRAITRAFSDAAFKAAFQEMLTGAITAAGRIEKEMKGAATDIRSNIENATKAASKSFQNTAKQAGVAGERIAKDWDEVGEGIRLIDNYIQEVVEAMNQGAGVSKEMRKSIEELGKTVRAEAAARVAAEREVNAAAATSGAARNTDIQEEMNLNRIAGRERELILRNITRAEADARKASMEADKIASREKIAQLRADSALEVAETRGASQIRLELLRMFRATAAATFTGIGRLIRTTFRGATSAVRSFANAATRLIRGFIRTTSSLVRGIGRSFRTAFNGLVGITRGVFSRITSVMRSAFRRQETMTRSSVNAQARQFERLEARTRTGLIGGLSGRSALGIGAGILSARGLGRLFGGGAKRLLDEEDARIQLERMGVELENIEFLLKGVDEAFAGSPFANPDGFSIASQLVASNIELERIPGIIGNIADLASHGNVPLDQMGSLFTRIASQGRVSGDELNRLTDANIPLTVVADVLGKTVQELRDMATAGELTSDIFFDAIDQVEMFEGAAKAAGDTTRGALANTRTAFNKIMADFLSPFFGKNGPAVQFFKNLQASVKSLSPTMKELGQRFADFIVPLVQEPPAFVIGLAEGLAAMLASKFVLEMLGLMLTLFRLLLRPVNLIRIAFLGLAAGVKMLGEEFPGVGYMFQIIRNQIGPTASAVSHLVRSLVNAFSELGSNEGVLMFAYEILRRILVTFGRVWVAVREFSGVLATNLDSFGFANFGRSLDLALANAFGAMLGRGSKADKARRDAARREGSFTLNILEESFLGPIVAFFRGPFADGVEAAIGVGFAAFNFALNRIIRPAVSGVVGYIQDFVSDVRNLGFATAFGNVGRDILTLLGNVWEAITGWFSRTFTWDNFVAFGGMLLGALGAIGSGIANWFSGSSLQTGLVGLWGAIAGWFGEFFTRENFAAFGTWFVNALGAIGGAIADWWEGSSLQANLNSLWDSVSAWFSETFTSDNIIAAVKLGLGGLFNLGRLIGGILGDPQVVLGFTVAILAAAATLASIVGSFIAGVFVGLLDNAPEWGQLIRDALSAAWDWATGGLDLSDVPIIGAIGDVFSSLAGSTVFDATFTLAAFALAGKFLGAIGAGITLLGTTVATSTQGAKFGLKTLGVNMGKALFSTMGATFNGLFRGGLGLISGGKFGGATGIGAEGGAFKNVGRAIGGSIMVGIGAGIAGYMAGQTGSQSNILLSILAGGAGGAALGFTIAGGIGAAVGGVLGAAAAGIGAFFGNAAREADEARAAVENFAQAIEQSGKAGAANAVLIEFRGLDKEQRDLLIDAGFNVAQLVDSAVEAEGLSGVFGDLFSGLSNGLDFFNMMDLAQLKEDLAAGALSLQEMKEVLQLPLDLYMPNFSDEQRNFQDWARRAGVDAEDLLNVLRFIEDQYGGIVDANILLGDQDALERIAEDGELVRKTFDDIREPLDALISSLIETGTPAGQALAHVSALLNAEGVTGKERIEAMEYATDQLASAAQDARNEIAGMFDDLVADKPEDILRGVRLDFADFAERVNSETGRMFSDDELMENIANFQQSIASALSSGIASGAIDSQEDFDAFIANLKKSLEDSGITGTAKTQMENFIAELEGTTITWPINVEIAAKSLAGLQSSVFGEATNATSGNALSPQTLGIEIDEQAFANLGRDGLEALLEPFRTDTAPSDAAAETTRKLDQTLAQHALGLDDQGKFAVESYARGMGFGNAAVTSAAASMVSSATDGLAAGTLAFYFAGRNLTDALARGMRDQLGAAAATAVAIANTVANAARRALGIASPSRVFRGIGVDIGRGFIQGIRDSAGEMASSLSDAIGTAIDKATNTARHRSSEVGVALFEQMIPDSAISRLDAAGAIQGIPLGLSQAAASTAQQFRDARQAQQDLIKYDRQLASINSRFKSGALGFQRLKSQLYQLWDSMRRGQIDVERYREEKARLQDVYRKGITNTDAYREALDRLGDRPAELTNELRGILRSGSRSLSPSNMLGQENRAAITSSLATIRDFGLQLVETGTSAASARNQMVRYRNQLINQAVQLGFNRKQVNQLVNAYGLSNTSLAAWVREVNQFNNQAKQAAALAERLAREEAARQRREEQIAEQRRLQDAQFEVGAINQQRYLRLLQQRIAGEKKYSEEWLAIWRQIQSVEAEILQSEEDKKQQAENDALRNQGIPRPSIEQFHLHVPYGDPEAIAAETANRLAYNTLVGR